MGSEGCSFVRLYPGAPEISKANINSAEHVSSRARRFCGPLNIASSIGWTVYPPIDFDLMWDGSQVYFMFGDYDGWIKVDRALLPDYADMFPQIAPPDAQQCMPMFLEAFPEPGIVQIWTGYAAKTPRGVSTWVRAPINHPMSGHYDVYDAVFATDWWTGGLIVNIRIKKTDVPITFRRHQPLAQILFVDEQYLGTDTSRNVEILAAQPDDAPFWDSFKSNSIRRNSEKRGSYVKELNKQRKMDRERTI